eukprot:1142653-Pelagomonas_calceolata.AAC.5
MKRIILKVSHRHPHYELVSNHYWLCAQKERKVCASQRPSALRKGPLTSRLARASPNVPPYYIS